MQYQHLRIYSLFIVLFPIVQCYYLPPEDDGVYAHIKQGQVRGVQLKTRTGKAVSAFRGIPYAKPPVGPLRFQEPQEAEAWNGCLDATKDKSMCIQKNYLVQDPQVEGDEDCLYINVYVPQILSKNQIVKSRYSVMVYMHGGGWFSGSGASDLHGPEYILDENVILVTLNYRLGVLGFLSSGDDVAPGNWAFKDMTLALEWVQENIDKFGGKANSVTIFGQSAGSASVQYLMLSPRTKGLFHRAISQSGSALNLWATPINSIEITKLQAQFVNCSVTDVTNEQLMECLRNVNATVLVDSADKFKFWSVDPLTVYTPSIEKKSARNPNPFVSDHPLNILKNGQYQHVPYMMGVMKNEGIIRAAPIVSHENLRTDLNKRWNELGPEIFALSLSVDKDSILNLWQNITDFYMDGQMIDITNNITIENFVKVYSDRAFIYGMYQSAMQHAKFDKVYFYKFDYAGRYTWSDIFAATEQPISYKFNTSHCDDLIYLFKSPSLFPELPADSVELEMSKKMVRLWATFAKEGTPARYWKPMQRNDPTFKYLNIISPDEFTMKIDDFLPDRMDFWKNANIAENR